MNYFANLHPRDESDQYLDQLQRSGRVRKEGRRRTEEACKVSLQLAISYIIFGRNQREKEGF